MTYGQRQAELRKAAKMTQMELAVATKLSISTIAGLENSEEGKLPTLGNAIRIARALGVSMDELTRFDLPEGETDEMRQATTRSARKKGT